MDPPLLHAALNRSARGRRSARPRTRSYSSASMPIRLVQDLAVRRRRLPIDVLPRVPEVRAKEGLRALCNMHRCRRGCQERHLPRPCSARGGSRRPVVSVARPFTRKVSPTPGMMRSRRAGSRGCSAASRRCGCQAARGRGGGCGRRGYARSPESPRGSRLELPSRVGGRGQNGDSSMEAARGRFQPVAIFELGPPSFIALVPPITPRAPPRS